jgi:nucleotide-binding universal stress UspA family protein
MPTSHILVPHDGTEMSDMALSKATEFAKALDAEITIVHIVDNRFIPSDYSLSFVSEKTSFEDARTQLIRILKTGAESMLKDRMSKARDAGVRARFLLGIGSPAEEILLMAKNEKADLIIMGSRRLGKDSLNTLGSVARRVSDIAQCPVMVVH